MKKKSTSKKQANKKYNIISLFAGCGGLDLGFKGGFKFLDKDYSRRNFELIWANDIEKNACLTFAKNISEKISCSDITKVLSDKNFKLPIDIDIVLGGFPCQDFSHAGKRLGFDSKRGVLYKSMAKVIKDTKAKMFVAENVKGLVTMDNGKALKTIIKDFESLGYNVTYSIYLAADYGVPQKRERVVIIGTRKDILPEFIHRKPVTSNNWLTISDAIKDLEYLDEGEFDNHYWSKAKKNKGQGNGVVDKNKPSPTMRAEHHGNIEFHWNGKRRLSAREAARIQSFPDNFVFYPSTSSAYKQIGNAVPPVLAWHLAQSIEEFLKSNLLTQ